MGIKNSLPNGIKKQIRDLDPNTATIAKIEELAQELVDFQSAQEDERGDKSDAWQDGNAGDTHREFLDAIESLVEALNAVTEAFEAIDTTNLPGGS